MEKTTKKDITFYLNEINSLSDEEIENLFENEEISAEDKEQLINKAITRIQNLSTKSFIKVSSWAEKVEEYKKNYFSKIEKMSYERFVELLFNGIYEPAIAEELAKTNTFKLHLQKEKEEGRENNLQCFDIERRLFNLVNIVEDLNTIGQEIIFLKLQNRIGNYPNKTENIRLLENTFLNKIIENMSNMSLNSKSIIIGFYLVKMYLQNQEVLTPRMIEFYLKYRVKELHLENICENIIVTLGEEELPAFYTLEGYVYKNGTLKIYYEYVMKFLAKYKEKTIEKEWNAMVNINFLLLFSHELKHVLQMNEYKEITQNKENLEWVNIVLTNSIMNYYARETWLKEKIGSEGYKKNHHLCIKEVQADIFSFFDVNKQLVTQLKNCYPEHIIINMVSTFAKRIVEFYTSEEGIMISPMEKFDAFYLENIGKQEEPIPIVKNDNPNILDSLMTGDKIPSDVYCFLQKIAKGEIKTTDLQQALINYLQQRNESSINDLEIETKSQISAL